MTDILAEVASRYQKPAVVGVRSGDSVRVHQRIKEANKERVQVFEGLVIRVDRPKSLSYRITVRKIASGVGVEKGFMVHSPNVVQVEIIKRARVRRNYLSYLRQRTGKAARLKTVDFDLKAANRLRPVKASRPVKSD